MAGGGKYINGLVADGIVSNVSWGVRPEGEIYRLKRRRFIDDTQLSSVSDSNAEDIAANLLGLKKLREELMNAIKEVSEKNNFNANYPVGIVAWFASNKNPNTLFPGTTWKYIGENRTVRLAKADGSDVFTTGGSDMVTLAAENMVAHTHYFGGNTGAFDYGTKTSSNFDFGDRGIAPSGAHAHWGVASRVEPWKIGGNQWTHFNFGHLGATDMEGDHTHQVYLGGHTHNVVIGAHTHSFEGVTGNFGSTKGFSVVNSFIKLMGWHRTA